MPFYNPELEAKTLRAMLEHCRAENEILRLTIGGQKIGITLLTIALIVAIVVAVVK